MQEIITRCDVCAELAEPVVVALGRTERRVVVDLCPAHDVELVGPLRELLTAHGRPIVDAEPGKPAPSSKPAAASSSKPYQCLGCDMPSKSAAGMSQHYKTHHNLGTVESVYGSLRCPLCARDLATAAALGSHALALHPEAHNPPGSAGAHDLYRHAADAGDPHGIVNAARGRLRELGARKSLKGAA